MKQSEVIKKLGVDKDRIKYFTKHKLLIKDGANTRELTEEYIRRLQLCVILTNSLLSVGDIKKIEAGELTFQEALENRVNIMEGKLSNSLNLARQLLEDKVDYENFPVEKYWEIFQDVLAEGKDFISTVDNDRDYIDCDTNYTLFITVTKKYSDLSKEDRTALLTSLFNYAKIVYDFLEAIKEDILEEYASPQICYEIPRGIEKLYLNTIEYFGGVASDFVSDLYIKTRKINGEVLLSMNYVYSEEGNELQDYLDDILSVTIYILRHLWSIDSNLPMSADIQEYGKLYGKEKANELIELVTELYKHYQGKRRFNYFNTNPSAIFRIIESIEKGVENQLLLKEVGLMILNEIISISSSYETAEECLKRRAIDRWIQMIDVGEWGELLEELEEINEKDPVVIE